MWTNGSEARLTLPGALFRASATQHHHPMSGLALKHRDPDQIPPDLRKKPRAPAKVSHALDLLLSGDAKTQKAAAQAAGISPEHLNRWINKPAGRVFIALKARQAIDKAQLPAVGTLIRLLDAKSEHVQADIAKHISAIAGFAPPSNNHGVQVNVNVTPGYVVKLRHAPDAAPGDGAIDITPGTDARPVAGETTEAGE